MEKTREEIDELKRQWERDPNWDIEETEGFESYMEELKVYADAKREEWDRAYKEKERQQLNKDCIAWGVNNPQLRNVIRDLKSKHDRLEEQYNDLEQKFYDFKQSVINQLNSIKRELP